LSTTSTAYRAQPGVDEVAVEIIAAVLRDRSRPFSIEQLELEEPRADEILVRIVAVGVCHTDLSVDVPVPVVLGHEGAGIVERVGTNIRKVRNGDHVILTFMSCGHCATCQRGSPAYCMKGDVSNFAAARSDGSSSLRKESEIIRSHFFGQSSFATYALASERNVVKIRRELPLELLAPLGCGVQTGAGAVFNSLRPRFGSSIAVFGIGSVGISAIMAARMAGCSTIIGVDMRDHRLDLSRELGATHTINVLDADPVTEIRKITGTGSDYALDMTGRPEIIRQAVECLNVRGICGLIGGAPQGTEMHLDYNSILLMGRSVRGILAGDSIPDLFIPQLIELYLQGRFPVDRLITFYQLDQINEAAEDSLSGKVLKPVLRPS
jgi:aryl-alcohol dehydrogenase